MNGFKFAESSISIHVLDMILQKLTHIFITREEKYDKVPNLEKGHSEPFSTITLKVYWEEKHRKIQQNLLKEAP